MSNFYLLQSIWALPQPWRLLPHRHGPSNLTEIIETPAGRFVLRTYAKDRALAQIRYEIAVLVQLEKLVLPFRVPIPVETLSGERFALVEDEVITLSPLLPGVHPSQSDGYEAGAALAHLVNALGQLHVETTDEVTPMPMFGDFEAWASEPLEIIKTLSIPEENIATIFRLVEAMQECVPDLYASFPRQITHRDYDASNILITNGSVVGVLDFEFCAPDLQLVDFAFALSQWWSDWGEMERFARGYTAHQPLKQKEIEALPTLFRLRALTTLWQRVERYRRGLLSEDALKYRVDGTVEREVWIQRVQHQLLERLGE